MSVKLRLKRMGRKKIPVYRVIAIDSRRQRDGKELERLGIYNPLPENPIFQIDEDRLFYWLEQGAQPSDTIRNLMKDHGLALKWHLKSQGKSQEEINREYQKWQLLRESKMPAVADQEKREEEEAPQKAEREAAKKTPAEEAAEEAAAAGVEEVEPAEDATETEVEDTAEASTEEDSQEKKEEAAGDDTVEATEETPEEAAEMSEEETAAEETDDESAAAEEEEEEAKETGKDKEDKE